MLQNDWQPLATCQKFVIQIQLGIAEYVLFIPQPICNACAGNSEIEQGDIPEILRGLFLPVANSHSNIKLGFVLIYSESFSSAGMKRKFRSFIVGSPMECVMLRIQCGFLLIRMGGNEGVEISAVLIAAPNKSKPGWGNASFFLTFTNGRLLWRFVSLNLPAGEAPCSRVIAFASPAKQQIFTLRKQ